MIKAEHSLHRQAWLYLLFRRLLSLVECWLWLNTFITCKLFKKVERNQFDSAEDKSHGEQQRHLQSAWSHYIVVTLAHSFCCVFVRAGRETIQEITADCPNWGQFRVSNQPNANFYELEEKITREECWVTLKMVGWLKTVIPSVETRVQISAQMGLKVCVTQSSFCVCQSNKTKLALRGVCTEGTVLTVLV